MLYCGENGEGVHIGLEDMGWARLLPRCAAGARHAPMVPSRGALRK